MSAFAALANAATAPARVLPAGAWDTHAHVFGPFERFPVTPESRYQPPLAPRQAHTEMLRTAGFDNAVLVHASANGFDNRGTLDAVQQSGGHMRGVGVVAPETSDKILLEMHKQGMRGIRFTDTSETCGGPVTPGVLGLASLRAWTPRLRVLGWHAQVWARCTHLASHAEALADAGVAVVIDHMGFFDATRGVDDPAFQGFLRLLECGTVWVKMTPIRVTRQNWRDCADVRPFHDALLAKAPHRLLWGSDWPYIGLHSDLPRVGALVDLFDLWTPDTALRRQIFIDNPAVLYGS